MNMYKYLIFHVLQYHFIVSKQTQFDILKICLHELKQYNKGTKKSSFDALFALNFHPYNTLIDI